MTTKKSKKRIEYELPFREDDGNGENISAGDAKEIIPEGYKIVFDKKVAVFPSEVITLNQSQV